MPNNEQISLAKLKSKMRAKSVFFPVKIVKYGKKKDQYQVESREYWPVDMIEKAMSKQK